MVGGAAKVNISEQDLSTRVSSTSGVYLGMAVPAIRGPLTPQLITNPTDFLNRYTTTGKVLVGYDTAYLEVLTALAECNKIWISRAVQNALYGAAFVRVTGASKPNGAAEFLFSDPDNDYDLTSVDGRIAIAPANFTIDSSQNALTVSAAFYAMAVTGDSVQLTTTGTLPTGLATSTNYYIIKLPTAQRIQLATSAPNATSGTFIPMSSAGVGTHTVTQSTKSDNATFTTDYTTDQLTVSATFYGSIATGDACQVSNFGGALPTGLAGSTTYYIIKVGSNVIQLATSLANANGGNPINLTGNGTGTQTISLTAKAASGTFSVDRSDDTLTVTPLFFATVQTGDALQLAATSGALPSALDPTTTYYAIVTTSTNKIKLATSAPNAAAGTAINLTDPGTGVYTVTITAIQTETSNNQKALLLVGSDPGLWNGQLGYTLTNYATNPTLVKEPGAFMVQVYMGVTLVESWTCSRQLNAKDGRNQALYVEQVLQGSNYIRAIDNIAVDATITPADQLTIMSFSSGSDGDAVTDSVMVNAINQLSSPEQFALSLVNDSGWSTPTYQLAIINLCETRGDCAFVLSTPFEVEASSTYLNDLLAYKGTTLGSQSNFGGIWTSHLLINDNDNSRQVYISPSAHVSARIANIWDTTNAWQPAAGNIYGQLNVLGVHLAFQPGDMDALYDANINPIRWRTGSGATIWGQKTLQTRPSDLDRMNARLLLCVIRPAIKTLLENFLFALETVENDSGTRAAISAQVTAFMNTIKSRKGVYDFQFICNDTNNSDSDIENNTMNAWLLVKITKSVEYINFVIGITPYSVTFDLAATQLAA